MASQAAPSQGIGLSMKAFSGAARFNLGRR
jgi:hypothetical protein